jgi:hypothetical protein
MDKQELTIKQKLVERQNKGEQAALVSQLLTDWLEAYQEMTIGYLKSCPVSQVMDYRNKLVASEAFSGYLQSLIDDGVIANMDFDRVEAEKSYKAQEDWLKHLKGDF